MQVFVIAGVIAVVLILMIIGILTRYKKCRSDEVLVVYGKTSGKASAKCYHGGAAFVIPVIQGYAVMSMRPMQIQCNLAGALSSQKIEVNVPTVVTVAISSDPEVMQNAAVRLLGLDEHEKINQIKDVVWGQMRLVIAEMTVEQLISDRDKFLGSCKNNISEELKKFGLALININISDISDNADYIVNLGKKAAAEAKYRALADIEEKTKDGEVGIATQRKEKAVSLAQISRDQETEVAKNDREQQTVVAETQKERDIQLRNTEKEKNVGIAEREKEETVRTREIQKDQQVETASLEKEEATSVANIEKEQSIEVATAESVKQQKVAEQRKLRDVAVAQQAALTESETAAANAERDAKIAEKQAESRTAQQKATQDSDASIVEFQQQADARKETATQEAEAKKKAAEQEKMSKVAEAKAATQKRTAIASKDAKLTENTAGIEVAKSDAKLGVERAEADKAIGESRANAEKAVGIANAQKEAEVAKALAEAEKAKQTANIMVGTEIEAERKAKEADGVRKQIMIEANAEAEAVKMKAEAEAEAKRLVLKAEAEGRMAIAAALQAENAAKTAELQALLHAGMEGGQVVQIVLKDELEKIARADAEKFEHLHLGNVTVVGGADAAPSFLGKVVETVSKVNGLKENIPGIGGLLGMLGSFDQKHMTGTQEKAPETK